MWVTFCTRSLISNMSDNVCQSVRSGTGHGSSVFLVDSARTHESCERNFAVGDAEAAPRALHASECIEMLDPTKTSYVILV
jgi:hypothetical protein